MKEYLFPSALLALVVFSCRKPAADHIPTSIVGTWKMIVVKDNASNATLTKPSSIQGNVIITFVPDSDTTGTFFGNTPSNAFAGFDSSSNKKGYTIGPIQSISIPMLLMLSKVAEISWGEQFLDNITEAQQYSFETGARLNIRTTKKVFTFQKQ
jgi:hypothetical protein